MKVIVTGANGTVGTAVCAELARRGDTAVPWNRHDVPVDDADGMRRFLDAEQPDGVMHLAVASQSTGLENEGWLVNQQWPRLLAQLTHERGVRFLFTSSVMVYSDDAKGPFTVDTVPDAQPGSYGYEKLLAEQAVFGQHPEAVVARIGWQIGYGQTGNQMLAFLHRQIEETGQIEASRRWYPACSFLPDTAVVLCNLLQTGRGLYLVDSNERWSFLEIVRAIDARRGIPWNIVPNEAFVYDQRMIDPRPQTPSLSTRLILL